MLDVGQGQAVLLRDAVGTAVLVDAGPPGAPAPAVAGLRRHGVGRLDLLVLTHGARDQAGAVGELAERVATARAVHGPFGDGPGEADGLRALAGLEAAGVPIAETAAGARFVVGQWTLEVLSPRTGSGVTVAANDRSLVIMARAPGLTALIPSDAEGPVLLRLPLPRADVLVVAHHGSEDPDLGAVLDRVRPRLAVISVGAENRHGHPAPRTLEEIRAHGVPVQRTDMGGDLRIAPPGLRPP